MLPFLSLLPLLLLLPLLSLLLLSLLSFLIVRKNEAGIVQRNSTKFEENVEERQMDDTTFRNDINYLNDRGSLVAMDTMMIFGILL